MLQETNWLALSGVKLSVPKPFDPVRSMVVGLVVGGV